MTDSDAYPDCIRYHAENNSTMFAVTDENGEVVAVHEVFLDGNAAEIGRRTTGSAKDGFVRFSGEGPAMIYRGEPEEGMRLWTETGKEVWVDVSAVPDSALSAN